MTLFKNKYRIETTRLKGWDYKNEGYYFITICVKDKIPIFGKIKDGEIILNEKGMIAKKIWERLTEYYKYIKLHEYIIMPDHFHGIIQIKKYKDTTSMLTQRKSLSAIIGGFKSYTTKEINKKTNLKKKIWQSRFYDRIIRDEFEFYYVTEYIRNNALKEHLGYDEPLVINKNRRDRRSITGLKETRQG